MTKKQESLEFVRKADGNIYLPCPKVNTASTLLCSDTVPVAFTRGSHNEFIIGSTEDHTTVSITIAKDSLHVATHVSGHMGSDSTAVYTRVPPTKAQSSN